MHLPKIVAFFAIAGTTFTAAASPLPTPSPFGEAPLEPQMPDVSHELLAEHAAQSHQMTPDQVGWLSQGAWDEDHCSLTIYPPSGPLCFPGIPNGHHSWDPDTNLFWTEPAWWGDFGPGLEHADILFRRAVNAFEGGNAPAAYLWLGRSVHMLGDAGTPAHVLLDTHLPGDPDTYENWLSQDGQANTRAWIQANPPDPAWDMDFHMLPVWEALDIELQGELNQASQVYGGRSSGQALWELGPIGNDRVLFQLMFLIAEAADNWDSDDIQGEHFHGEVSDPGYLTQIREDLFPLVTRYSSGLIGYFEQTVLPPPPPILISPADGGRIIGNSPEFRWHPVGVDPIYRIEIAEDPEFNHTILSEQTGVPAFRPDPILSPGQYYWRAQATTVVGTGNWSTVWSFQIDWIVYAPLVIQTGPVR